jgi:putative IMPACT (imprinted ancient) family translation regulator
MLEVLRHQDLQGVMASVVRYFGGVKLGAGGLVRAYTDAVAQALLGAEKIPPDCASAAGLQRALCFRRLGAPRVGLGASTVARRAPRQCGDAAI